MLLKELIRDKNLAFEDILQTYPVGGIPPMALSGIGLDAILILKYGEKVVRSDILEVQGALIEALKYNYYPKWAKFYEMMVLANGFNPLETHKNRIEINNTGGSRTKENDKKVEDDYVSAFNSNINDPRLDLVDKAEVVTTEDNTTTVDTNGTQVHNISENKDTVLKNVQDFLDFRQKQNLNDLIIQDFLDLTTLQIY